jgi:DNA polymerase IV
MAHIVHIDLNDFLVSVERKHDPSLKGRAVVIGGQPTGWGRVVAASREAAQRGVKPGMSLSVAASRCPSAIFLDGEFDRYLDASAGIDELLREPRLPVEWTSIDSVFIDASGGGFRPGGAFGAWGAAAANASRANARQVAERLQTALRDQLGFEAAVGIASTKIAAQIASRLARPAGLLYVLPGYEERLLAPLDVSLLPDLPPGMGPKLHRASVMTLGHLAQLDPLKAETLLGRRAGEFARLARGLDDRKVDGAAPPRSVARDVTLPEATTSPAEMESIAQYLTETLAGRLRRMSCFAQTVTVRLRGGTPERTFSRSTSLREATANDGDLVVAAHALLNTLRRQARSVVGISIALSNLHHGGAQLPLFPLSPVATQDNNWADLRGRAGFRALVHGHFVSQPALGGLRRRAG